MQIRGWAASGRVRIDPVLLDAEAVLGQQALVVGADARVLGEGQGGPRRPDRRAPGGALGHRLPEECQGAGLLRLGLGVHISADR